jgi:hypothetical protein
MANALACSLGLAGYAVTCHSLLMAGSSRPFWLNVGFHPAGYSVLRLIEGGTPGPARNAPQSLGGN